MVPCQRAAENESLDNIDRLAAGPDLSAAMVAMLRLTRPAIMLASKPCAQSLGSPGTTAGSGQEFDALTAAASHNRAFPKIAQPMAGVPQ